MFMENVTFALHRLQLFIVMCKCVGILMKGVDVFIGYWTMLDFNKRDCIPF